MSGLLADLHAHELSMHGTDFHDQDVRDWESANPITESGGALAWTSWPFAT